MRRIKIAKTHGGRFWIPLGRKNRIKEGFEILQQFGLEGYCDHKAFELPEGEGNIYTIERGELVSED